MKQSTFREKLIGKKIQINLVGLVILPLLNGCGGINNGIAMPIIPITQIPITTNIEDKSYHTHTLLEDNPGHQQQESHYLYDLSTGVDKSAIPSFNAVQTELYNTWNATGNLPFTILIQMDWPTDVMSITTTIEQNGYRINSEFKYSLDSAKNSVKFNNYLVGTKLTSLIIEPASTSYFSILNVKYKMLLLLNAFPYQNMSPHHRKCELKGLIKLISSKPQEPHKIWYSSEITEGKLDDIALTASQLSNDFSLVDSIGIDSMRSLLNSFIAEPLLVSLN